MAGRHPVAAECSGRDFQEADLAGADMTDASFTGANPKGVRGLPPSQR
ncbi:pentapeptide repeat-containing protein [Streptomyces sp. NPDC001876]